MVEVLFTSAWALTLIVQVSGALLIGWRTVGTPQKVGHGKRKAGIPMMVFYASIESGCLALATELVALVFLYRNPIAGGIVLNVLGQVTVSLYNSISYFALFNAFLPGAILAGHPRA